MKTIIILLLAGIISLASCTTIKTISDFTIGQEHYEGSQIMYKHGKAIKWKSKSHPQWAEVEKSNMKDFEKSIKSDSE